jgi:C1A family cysteine protease
LKLNRRAHYTREEFKNKFLLKLNLNNERLIYKKNDLINKKKSFKTTKKLKTTTTLPPPPALPIYLNWTEKGVMGPVLDQQDCGCCYAFVSVYMIFLLNLLIPSIYL